MEIFKRNLSKNTSCPFHPDIDRFDKDIKLNPWFVTGLSDGDGSFYIVLRKDNTCVFGFSVNLEYKVVAAVNPLNLKLLELVQSFFGGYGIISKNRNTYIYVIRNRKHLRRV